jgi:hypothetical protein
MKYLVTTTAGVLGALLMATAANAAVVCNDAGDCWRVKEKHQYPAGVNIHIYGDDWKWDDADAANYRWRDAREGRGYWRDGVWITF